MKDRIHKSQARAEEAIAILLCDLDGNIVEVENNNLFDSNTVREGCRLPDLFDERSGGAAMRIVRALRQGKTIIAWEVSVPTKNRGVHTVYVSGLRQIDQLVVLLSTLPGGFFELVGRLVRISREHSVSRQTSSEGFSHETGVIDDQILDELSRLNNELANAQRELSLKNAALEALNTEKDKVLGVVVHDLRNPLSVVAMCAKIISERNKRHSYEKEDYKLLQNIKSSSAFMNTMIEDILYITKNRLGKIMLSMEDVELGKFVRDTIDLNRMISWEKKISIELDIPESLGVARIDPGKMRQVFNNLIGNSVRLSPGNSTISVFVSKHDEVLTVRITDQGPGIPAEEQEQFLEDFPEGTEVLNKYVNSGGFGLSICKSIIEAHGGKIGFETAGGVGSTFFFNFPCR